MKEKENGRGESGAELGVEEKECNMCEGMEKKKRKKRNRKEKLDMKRRKNENVNIWRKGKRGEEFVIKKTIH